MMDDTEDRKTEKSADEFYIDTFRPQDAAGIVELFRSVYGEGYPVRLFYNPGEIIAVNEAGKYYSIVARTASEKVIGVVHLYHSTPNPLLYECGVGLVSKEYRNSGASTSLLDYLFTNFVPHKDNIEEVFGEAVCNHVFMQKALLRFGYVPTALEIALMPASAYVQEKSADGRVASLNGFRCYKPKHHMVYLPAHYEQDLRWLYSLIDDSRDIALSAGQAPGGTASRISMEIFDLAQVARIAVHTSGDDFISAFTRSEKQAIAKNVVVIQAWINLAEPWTGATVEELRKRGYFFGGLLPRWFDSDGFLMQKLLCPPDFEGIVLDAANAQQLFDIIRRDRKRVGATGQPSERH
jgi:hypothetical protein